jgi:hypothetical protein
MNDSLKLLKLRIKDSGLYDPRISRELQFLKDHFWYMRRYLFERDRWKTAFESPFTLLGFNITDQCNAQCCYCAQRFAKPDGVMGMSLYEKGIREFSEMGGGTIGFSPLDGEPLLDPLLARRMEFASQFENIRGILFDTNGILLRRADIRRLFFEYASRMRITMNISLPGFEREMFERVFNVAWDDSILHGIEDLLRRNRDLGYPLDINLALQPDCGGVITGANFRKFILPNIRLKNILLDSRVVDNWCGQIEEDHLTGSMLLRRKIGFQKIPCEYLLDGHLDILMNGDVRLCGCRYGAEGKHDELVIGNIMRQRLSEIWFGGGPGRLCERFLSMDIPRVCRECSLYTTVDTIN